MGMLPIVLYLLEFGMKVLGTFCQKQVGVSAILFRGEGGGGVHDAVSLVAFERPEVFINNVTGK